MKTTSKDLLPTMSCDVDPYIFTTDTLPTNLRFLPPMANGLLGWTVYNNIMHMGSVYNGEGGRCHRADVPCPLAVRLETDEPAQHTYSLDTHTGTVSAVCDMYELLLRVFFTVSFSYPGIFSHTLSTDSFTASQSLYSHRYYSNMMVMEVLLVRKVASEEPHTVKLISSFSPQSKDIAFEFGPDYKGGRCG